MSFNTGNESESRNVFLPNADVRWCYKSRTHVDKQGVRSIVGEFTATDEDHTIGQLLRLAYGNDPRVMGCEYLIPHPLENVMRIRCQTNSGLTPPEAIDQTLARCLADIQRLRTQIVTSISPVPGTIIAAAIPARD